MVAADLFLMDRYLDRCHKLGVKVLYDMSSLGFSAGATPARNYVHDWASEAWQEAVKGNVSLVAGHPALLAYCESLPAALVVAIKDIGPCP